jgi:NAD(P)-dependent dehydrogenase (short-subunit alcohol dehydrogenase family)
MSAYLISKTALIRLSESLALDTVEDGIRVFAIHPGTARTLMNDYIHDSLEVAKNAPWLQQWYQALYAQGLHTPIELSVRLVHSTSHTALCRTLQSGRHMPHTIHRERVESYFLAHSQACRGGATSFR